MASIRKRTPWRVVVNKGTAAATVFSSLKQAISAAKILVDSGIVTGFVQEPKKGNVVGPTMAVVERAPGGVGRFASAASLRPTSSSLFRGRAMPTTGPLSARAKSESKLQFVDYRQADKNSLGDLLTRFMSDRLQGRDKHDPDIVRTRKLCGHSISGIKMSILQASDIAAYRDERVKTVKGTTVKKELELLSRVIAIARAEWNIHMASNPASGRLVKRPAPQDGDVRDRRLAEVHVPVKAKAIAKLAAADHIDGGALEAKSVASARRKRPDEDYEDDPETAALLALPQSEQQALLRAFRYPAWFTQRKRVVTAATLKARLRRRAPAPVKARLRGGCRL